jgi:biopolymer transport protein ExbD
VAIRLDHGADELAEVHEINVTPFIDVMLVLLIIFMVAAPLATVDVSLDLPVSSAQPQPRPDKPLFLTIKNDHSLALGDDTIAQDDSAGLSTRPPSTTRTSASFCAPTSRLIMAP